ncbi:MAG: UMP kinase [bacterium]
MQHTFGKTIIIGLGGSVMYPETIDTAFLKKFNAFVRKRLDNNRFIIVVGGGRTARIYQEAAAKVVKTSNEDKDWLGIHATRANGHLLRAIFADVADPTVIDVRGKIQKLQYPITIAAGWRPGWSTDYVAVALAEDFNIKEVIAAGKPDYIYDKDPSKYKNAKPFDYLLWSEYRAMIPNEWIPGAHAPIDTVAAKAAAEAHKTVIVINPKDFLNFGNLLAGKNFKGTVVF